MSAYDRYARVIDRLAPALRAIAYICFTAAFAIWLAMFMAGVRQFYL
jgi:hypothetical protein